LPGRLGPLPVLESELDDDAELDDLVRGQRPAAHFWHGPRGRRSCYVAETKQSYVGNSRLADGLVLGSPEARSFRAFLAGLHGVRGLTTPRRL